MYFKKSDLKKELYKWTNHNMLYARRIDDSNRKRAFKLIPLPQVVIPGTLPPESERIPIYKPAPAVDETPKSKAHFTRAKLGQTLLERSYVFDLSDPERKELKIQYDALHDPNIAHYLYFEQVHKYLVQKGIVDENDRVKCNLKTFNDYRHYLWVNMRKGVIEILNQQKAVKAQKHKFGEFLEATQRTKMDTAQIMSCEKGIFARQVVRLFNKALKEGMFRETRRNAKAKKRLALQSRQLRLYQEKKEREFPKERERRLKLSLLPANERCVHLIHRKMRKNAWKNKARKLLENCAKLKNELLELKWKRKFMIQKLGLARDLLIQKDMREFSGRRRRMRDLVYELDRTAMNEKYHRLRYTEDRGNLIDFSHRFKYEIIANFLVGKWDDGRWCPSQSEVLDLFSPIHQKDRWPLVDEPAFKGIEPPPYVNEDPPFIKNLDRKRYNCKIIDTGKLTGRLTVDKVGTKVVNECVLKYGERFIFRQVKTICAARLAKHLKYLKQVLANLKFKCLKYKKPLLKHIIPRYYDRTRKLSRRAVEDNMSPKEIIRLKLIFAVRRYMKFERRRLRNQLSPEWSYSKRHSSKYSPKPSKPSIWTCIDLYYPLLSEETHFKDWKKNCLSLGKYLLHILVNSSTYGEKRQKIRSQHTMFRACIFKMKNKVRIFFDTVRRLVGPRIVCHYVENKPISPGVVRGYFRKMLPKNRQSGDEYILSLTKYLMHYPLKSMHLQHIGPLADMLMMNLLCPKSFPLKYRKYHIDFYKKNITMKDLYPPKRRCYYQPKGADTHWVARERRRDRRESAWAAKRQEIICYLRDLQLRQDLPFLYEHIKHKKIEKRYKRLCKP